MVHRIARQHLVPHGETEREPQHDAGLLGSVVACFASCFRKWSHRATPISRSVRFANAGSTRFACSARRAAGCVSRSGPPARCPPASTSTRSGNGLSGRERRSRGLEQARGRRAWPSAPALRPSGCAGGLHEPGPAVPIAVAGTRDHPTAGGVRGSRCRRRCRSTRRGALIGSPPSRTAGDSGSCCCGDPARTSESGELQVLAEPIRARTMPCVRQS